MGVHGEGLFVRDGMQEIGVLVRAYPHRTSLLSASSTATRPSRERQDGAPWPHFCILSSKTASDALASSSCPTLQTRGWRTRSSTMRRPSGSARAAPTINARSEHLHQLLARTAKQDHYCNLLMPTNAEPHPQQRPRTETAIHSSRPPPPSPDARPQTMPRL